MEEGIAARYWCYMCSQMVNPIMGLEMKCPFCQSGFIEEMDGATRDNHEADSEFGPDRPLSLWAPILMGMMNNPRTRRRRLRRHDFDEDEDEDEDNENENENDDSHGGDTELDRELESIIRRRRRSSSTILQLLRGIRAAGLASESDTSGSDRDRDRERERERERLILINPFNQTIILHGSYDSSQGQNNNHTPIGSLGDYFIGPGLDLLLQHLAENDPNRYGTPPAQKEAVEALPTVTIKENVQCSVCLDDLEIGVEAKEMPCKHKFHGKCILPWLELHSSCPVCRFQLPADEAKRDSNNSRNSSNQRDSENSGADGEEGDEDGDGIGIGRNGSGRRFQIPWPFNLFSSTESQSSGSGVNSSASANAAGSGSGSASSQTDDN